jgi:hypothetical protein
MPAREIMRLYRQKKLHSGPDGPIVKKKKQAIAIQLSEARKEGHDIPEVKGSMQDGGLVPETGAYKLHEGERVVPVANRTEATDLFASRPEERPRKEPPGRVPGYRAGKMPTGMGGAFERR